MVEHLNAARPLVWAGNGIRLSRETVGFCQFIEESGIPFVTTWLGADLFPTDHEQNIGIVGVSGHPGANRAVHECDLLLVLGSHLSLTQTSTLVKEFAPNARKIVIDIDQDQLENLTVEAETVCADLTDFFDVQDIPVMNRPEWWARCQVLKKEKVPLVGSYLFNDKMTRLLPEGSIMVVDGGGTALYTGFQSSYIKEGSRLICSTAISAMGSGLPEAIGACLARSSQLTTCLIGDGSLMLNLQELQTIRHLGLPVKVFVLNNGGYLAIKHTQMSFLGGRLHGVGAPDISFPDTKMIAEAFGLPYFLLREPYNELEISGVLGGKGPVLCEVMVPADQQMVRQGYRKDGERFVPQNLSEMAV